MKRVCLKGDWSSGSQLSELCLWLRSMQHFCSWWHKCFWKMPSLTPLWSIAVGAVTKEGPQGRNSAHPVVNGGHGKRLSCLWALWLLSVPMGSASSIEAMLPRAFLQTFSESRTSMQCTGEDKDPALHKWTKWTCTTTRLWHFLLEKIIFCSKKC